LVKVVMGRALAIERLNWLDLVWRRRRRRRSWLFCWKKRGDLI